MTKKKRIEKNWLEWAVFGLGAVLVCGVLGFLIYDGATAADGPAEFQIEFGRHERRADGFHVPVRVKNVGGETAEGVHVEVVLEAAGREERGEFVVAFLPRGGAREASVTFHSDPGAGTLRARVLGYEKP
ncbi:MAG TPA: hypothetical protein VK421_12090 [Pyrinomonadaceae bacterium]|nr:hypothetical protein [Pyrinomonadaceae bacterium]